MPKDNVVPVAIACSDLHLSLTPPACRKDKDWMETQAGYLKQLKEAADGLPILCAGDIFDRWNTPPELINFALDHLPDGMLCVPGQHDLPYHDIEQVHRSGYGVLVNANKIVDLHSTAFNLVSDPYICGNLAISGFGWGQEITPIKDANDFNIAVVHRYCWIPGAEYPGAPEESRLKALKSQLEGYDVAFFGDNHKGFLASVGDCQVMNCGGFIRRKSDEIPYVPKIGVLYSDGTIKRRPLDTSKDEFHPIEKERSETPFDMQAFLSNLEGLGEHGLDFREAIKNHLQSEDIDPKTKEIIYTALESHE